MINLTSFKPQLIGEGNINYFLFNNEAVFIEPKIDGVRILLEKRGNSIKLYSRTGKEWTSKFKSIIGSMKDEIAADNVILDGEIAVVNGNRFTSSNFVLRNKLNSNERLVYFPFDVLEIDNFSMIEQALITRKQNLSLVLKGDSVVQAVPFRCTNSIVDVQDYYKKCIENGVEGIVIKNNGAYKPNSRFDWLKLKPMRTLDMQVLDREPRKDGKGWIYSLKNNTCLAKATSSLDINNGCTVEVKYEKELITSLRFPQILRVRFDK